MSSCCHETRKVWLRFLCDVIQYKVAALRLRASDFMDPRVLTDAERLSCRVSLSPGILRFTLVLCLLLLRCTPVEGQPRVIGSPRPIVASPGDDVILPCHVEPARDVAGLTVEWSRPDLRPDPNDRLRRVAYVHLYRDGHEVPDMKMAEFVNRTTLSASDLRHGNLSLRITNVTLADGGRFRCFIPKLKSQTRFSVVRLVVEPKSAQTWTTETPLQPTAKNPDPTGESDVNGSSHRSRIGVSCVLAMILVGGLVGFLTHKYQKQKLMKRPLVSAPLV